MQVRQPAAKITLPTIMHCCRINLQLQLYTGIVEYAEFELLLSKAFDRAK